ncbi:tyrosinase family protein [Geodermatophilus sp. CPCC 205761]|uniref:tyrosinase family protein n=1 Tax=Geodermatophilus sp. CPCC 205761 TaxID=2936597 RepID=UPI003EF07CC2
MATQPRIRKSIDSLTPGELADYEHAFARLKAISDADPTSIDGLQYFADLHNTMLGPCEHANDTFLPWHRAHLFLFEEALRRSDPPRTSNVTLPYWDWSALPSGVRFPKAFEDENSVLHHALRNDDPVCRPDSAPGCQALPFPRAYLEEQVLAKPDWSTIDPALSSTSFGGHTGGQMDCQGQFGEGFGALEQPAHNAMHDGFIGGTMADPGTAAEDPMFFSFHCYIDLLWAQWQERFETGTDLDCRLCGLFKDREHLEENRFLVRDTLDTEKQFGYVYDYVPGEAPPPLPDVDGAPFRVHPALDVVPSARREPALVRTLAFSVPQPGLEEAVLRLGDVHVTLPFSYGADVYLTRAGEELHTMDREFRQRHLADVLYFWRSHHAHGHTTHDVTVDLGRVLTALAGAHAGEEWQVSVALTPTAGGHEHGPAEAAAGPSDAASMVDFGDLTLRVR